MIRYKYRTMIRLKATHPPHSNNTTHARVMRLSETS